MIEYEKTEAEAKIVVRVSARLKKKAEAEKIIFMNQPKYRNHLIQNNLMTFSHYLMLATNQACISKNKVAPSERHVENDQQVQ
jgi:hypothetical protein